MQKTIVIGATGTIGSALVILLKKNGHEVIAASRKGEHPVDIDNPESIANLFSKMNSMDNIICVAGNASFGSFSQLTDEQFDLGIKSKLMGQVNVVREGLKILNPNGSIILTGGMLAYEPWPATSAITMVNAGLEGFVRAAALDITGGRKLLIVHPPFVKETALAMGLPSDNLLKASEVVHPYLKGLESSKSGAVLFV